MVPKFFNFHYQFSNIMNRIKSFFTKKVKLFTVVISIVFFGAISVAFQDNYFEVSRNLDIFGTMFKELNMYYVDETKPGELMKTGIDAMLESLDPYTNYIPESDIEDYRFMTTGEYGGIGALIGRKDNYVVITDPYEGYPAQKAGLRAGDVILEVEGHSTKTKGTDDVSKILKGQPGTDVKLLVKRDGVDKPFEMKITRAEVKIPSVTYSGAVSDGVGYIRLTSFTENAGSEVRTAMLDLMTKHKITSLVLDLRGNPGGLLNEAVNIVNLFVEKGTLVVSTKGKVKEWDKEYKALNPATDTEIKLAVLVNSGSASASEIVSGAVQDLDRGIVIGTRTFGKGLVQTTRPLTYNSQLKVTTAKYYIPSGRCIQALDYSHRNEDGSVGHVPDSLISQFKTKSGRIVYDGGGVMPDFKTDPEQLSAIAQSLLSKYLIFDYATKYHQQHESIAAARTFRMTDAEYNEFVTWLNTKDYDYKTKSEKLLDSLKVIAEREKYFDGFKTEYNALEAKMHHDKNADLNKFKEEIKELLENEIVSRYYYQKGRTEQDFAYDKELKKAIEALNNKTMFDEIMHRPSVK